MSRSFAMANQQVSAFYLGKKVLEKIPLATQHLFLVQHVSTKHIIIVQSCALDR